MKLKKMVIFDLEATCEDRDIIAEYPNEIIEIGAVMIDSDGKEIDTFEMFARPSLNPKLTNFCKELTTIKQSDVDNAEDLADVLIKFYEWSEGCSLVSWGGYDMRQIARDVLRQDISNVVDTKEMSNRHINFKKWYAKRKGLRREIGMGGALRAEKLELIGTHHRGIDDAKNITNILKIFIDEI